MESYRNGEVSFQHVFFFQLEEYRGIDKTDPRSFAYQLYEAFFKHVDVVAKHVFFLNGVARDYEQECAYFEAAIQNLGGIQLFVADVNSDGSIGGNTPGSSLEGRTRQKTLTAFILNECTISRLDCESSVDYPCSVESNYVLTMGIGNMMESHEVLALFLGTERARALHHVVEEPVMNLFPASMLQYLQRVCIVCERFALSMLRFTNVEYFVGLLDNYNTVNNLESSIGFNSRNQFTLLL